MQYQIFQQQQKIVVPYGHAPNDDVSVVDVGGC